MFIKIKCLATGLLLLCILAARAQVSPAIIDSLKKALPGAKEDTSKVNILTKLAMLCSRNDPKTGLTYSLQASELSEKLSFKPGMAVSYNSVGANYKSMGKFAEALEYYLRSLKINEELGAKEYIARNCSNIGILYRELKNFPKAIEYIGRALKENEKLDRKMGLVDNYSDMAIIYCEMKDDNKALEYFNRSLKISEQIDDKEGMAMVYSNIANVYIRQGKRELGIEYMRKSNEYNQAIGRKVGFAINDINLGALYLATATDSTKPPRADRSALLDTAIDYYKRSIEIFLEMSAHDNLATAYGDLAEAYKAKKDFQAAFESFRKHIAFRDSVYSNDNRVKLANLSAERAEIEKSKQEELTRLAQAKRRNEAIFFSIVSLVLIGFTIFLVRERRKSENLLLNILPAKVAAELKAKGSASASNFDNVTVLFTDFVNFTSMTESMNPNALVEELHTCFKAFDEIMARYGIEKIKTVGDAYIAVAGLPVPDPDHAVNVIRAALEITAFMKLRRQHAPGRSFDIRIGVNSGSVVAGIVGVKKFAYDIWGDTVNIAARMEQNSESGRINISQATYELVKDRFRCTYRGVQEAKNKGALAMYFVDGPAA